MAFSHGNANAADWLAWTAVDGCPTPAEFATKVEAHLGSAAAEAADRAGIRIWARIERVDRAPGMMPLWLGEARLIDGAGAVVNRRNISKSGEACADIADALSLVTALLLSTAPAQLPPPRPSPPAPAVPTPSPSTTHHPSMASLDGGASAGAGLLPGLGWAGEVRAMLTPQRASSRWPPLFSRFAWWSEGQATLASGQGSRLRLWTAGAGLCPLGSTWGSRSLALCAGIDAGRLQASGFGFNNATTRDMAFVAATAEVEAQQAILGPVFLVLSLRATVPLLGTRVTYATPSGEGQVYRTWLVAAIGHLGLGYRWH